VILYNESIRSKRVDSWTGFIWLLNEISGGLLCTR
jgi:hypothetical protein